MTNYVMEAEPGGPRTQAMLGPILREAGASFSMPALDEKRSAGQVFDVLRVGFEVVGDASLVWQGVKLLHEKFPEMVIRIWRSGEEPTGRHSER